MRLYRRSRNGCWKKWALASGSVTSTDQQRRGFNRARWTRPAGMGQGGSTVWEKKLAG